MRAPLPLGRYGRVDRFGLSKIARTAAAIAVPPLALTAGLQLPQMLMASTALAACSGTNTVDCTGGDAFGAPLTFNPSADFTLDFGDGTNVEAVSGASDGIRIPATGGNATAHDVTVNLKPLSSISATSGNGLWVNTDGAGNDIIITGEGSITASKVGILAITGRTGSPSGAGVISVTNDGFIQSGGFGIQAYRRSTTSGIGAADVFITNNDEIKSTGAGGIFVGQLGSNSAGYVTDASIGSAHVVNTDTINAQGAGAIGNGIWTHTTGDTKIENLAGGDITAANDGIAVYGLLSTPAVDIPFLGIHIPAVNNQPIASGGFATIINDDTIRAGNNGVSVFNLGGASITNGVDGEIHAAANGIQVGSSFGGTPLPNFGTVTVMNQGAVGTDAAKIGGNGVQILNTGAVTVTNCGTAAADGCAAAASQGQIVAKGDGINATSLTQGVTVNNNGHVDAGGDGIVATTLLGDATVNNTSADSIISVGDGILVDSGVNAFVKNTGSVVAKGDYGIGALALGDISVTQSGTIGAANGAGIGAFTLAGDITVDGFDAGSGKTYGSITSGADGILAVAGGNVTIDAGAIDSGSGGSYLGSFFSGGVIGMGGGDVSVTTHDTIKTTGNFGALAVSLNGAASVSVNAKIDPPMLVGAGAINFGAADSTTDVNALVEGVAVGALGGNFGTGNVNIHVNDTGNVNPDLSGSVASDGIGILALKAGDGNVDIGIAGAVKGLTNAATGGDGVHVDYGFGNGDVNVATFNNYDAWSNPNGHIGTIVAGDDGIEVNRLGGKGNVGMMLGADITASDNGVNIFRGADQGNNYVNVGIQFGAIPEDDVLKPMSITAANGNGINIVNLFTDGSQNADAETNVVVYQGSSVTAKNGSAISVVSTSLGLFGNHDVYVENHGTLTGDGGLFTPTVGVATDDKFFAMNGETGVVTTDPGNPYAVIYGVAAGKHIGIENHGSMTGSMDLASLTGGIDVDNVYGSGGIWNTSGLNNYASLDPININNHEDVDGNNATINAEGFTAFNFLTPQSATVNNAGVFNVVDRGVIPGMTFFHGLDDFNNASGLLDMQNGRSSYFAGIPVYGTGIGNLVWMSGSFNGGAASDLAVDTFIAGNTNFGGAVNSSSDLLVVDAVNHGNGGASTALYVNDTNPGPGEYNPQGIPVVGVLSGNTQLGDFALAGGPIDKGLFTYGLFLDRAPLYTPGYAPDAAAWVLASYPDASATALAQSLNIINNMWDTTAGGWIDRSGDLRGLYGAGSGGADLPMSGGSVNGANANGVWARAIGNWGWRNDSSTIQPFADQSVTLASNYNESLWAIQGGADHAIETAKGTFVVGLMGGYEANSVDFTSAGDSSNYTAPMAGIYANWIDGPAYVDTLFKADFLKADLNIGGDSATTNGVALGGRVETGYRYRMQGGWFVEPLASLSYVNTQLDSVELDNTNVDFDNGQSLRGELGFRSGGSWAEGDRLWQPYVTASLGNEFLGDNSVFLASGPGVTVSDSVRGLYGKAGLGVNVTNARRNVTTFLQGSYMFADDYQSGSAKGGFRFNW